MVYITMEIWNRVPTDSRAACRAIILGETNGGSPRSIFSSRIRRCRPVGYAFYDGAHPHLWWLRLQLPVRGGLICFRVGAPLCDLHASSLQDAMPLGHSSIMQITWVSVIPSFFRWECKIFFVALQHNFPILNSLLIIVFRVFKFLGIGLELHRALFRFVLNYWLSSGWFSVTNVSLVVWLVTYWLFMDGWRIVRCFWNYGFLYLWVFWIHDSNVNHLIKLWSHLRESCHLA